MNVTSFDNIDIGVLIDRKYGQCNSIFNIVENEFGDFDIVIKNTNRINSLLAQTKRQLIAADGKPIRWEIPTTLGADGIRSIFGNSTYTSAFPEVDFSKINVVNVILE